VTTTTPGMVCGHHHLYSALARGMPAPPKTPSNFAEILQQIWWRLDVALDLEMIRWSAMLGALEALEHGTTAIIDHHESPSAIEGSLDVISEACADVGVRVVCAYGVTNRHGSEGARKGLEENRRFIEGGGMGFVGIHAAFTCSPDTLESAAGLAADLGVGVHIHVCEGPQDVNAAELLRPLSREDWLLAHCVNLPESPGLKGTIAHNPRSNLNNDVGYADPARFENRVILGSDGIGAAMLEEFQIAYLCHRDSDVEASPETAWDWLGNGRDLVPGTNDDVVTWAYDEMSPWHVAYTPGIRPVRVEIDGEPVLDDGEPTRVDAKEIRAKAAEQAARLHSRL